jgi:phospholipid/cholesterol/gamma-HCH transport system permease protein
VSGQNLLTATQDGERLAFAAGGVWTAENAATLDRLVADAISKSRAATRIEVDLAHIERLDTFGAWLIERLRRGLVANGREPMIGGLDERFRTLAETVRDVAAPQAGRGSGVVLRALADLGRNVAGIGRTIVLFAQMLGEVTVAFLHALVQPRSFRFTAMVNQIDRVGWRAIPIVLLITFLIGAILAQQGIFHFRRFGADLYVVDMVGILVLREIGVLIVCVMVAGRSGSAYTAELGTMKMREEIDALRTMGRDPITILILPRVAALVIAVPMLTFLGSMAALYGGGLVAWLYGHIPPDVFLQRLRDAITTDHFLVGLIKAPFMALVIGIVACVEGLEVKGSAESLGRHTTASVVKSIFLVIALDGFFAMFFAAINM